MQFCKAKLRSLSVFIYLQRCIRLDESLLCQIIAQGFITSREVQQESTHRTLIFPHQRVESPSVAEYQYLADECDVVHSVNAPIGYTRLYRCDTSAYFFAK